MRQDLEVDIDGDASGYEAACKKAEAASRALEREVAKQERALAKQRAELRRHREEMERVGRGTTIAGAAMAAGLGLAAAAAISWESAWAGVAKTVDGTQAQMAQLEQGLRDLSKELPASHKEIAAVAEAAGQLGIKRESILSFTRTMIELGTATNLSADEAATALARISNIMGTAQSDIGRLGASLVALGNDGASTEKDIVEMALRIAGAGKQIGLSEGEVLGFANALSSVGVEAEAGGSAISRVFINIATAVDQGGAHLEDFARVAGMSTTDFSKAFRTDAGGAITAFITGLGKVKASGGSVFTTLSDLGLSEIRVRDALLRTSAAGDLLAHSLKVGNDGWRENTALIEEANKRYETTASKLRIAWNQLDDFGITVGETFLPAIGAAADKTGSWLDVLGDLPQPVKTAGSVLGAVATAATLAGGAFLWASPKIASFKDSFDSLGPRAQKFHGALSSVGNALTGPLGAALGVATIAVGVWIDHQAQAAERAREWARAIEEDAGALGANTRALSVHLLEEEGLLKVAQANGISLGTYTDAIMGSKDAHDQVTAALDAQIAVLKAKADADQLSFEGYRAGVEPLISLKSALRGQNEELQAGLEKYRRQQEAQAGAAGAAKTHADAERVLTQQMQAADTTAKELRQALDALTAGHMKADQALISYRSALATLNEGIKKNGQSLDYNTEKGRANRSNLIAVAKAAADRVVSLKEEGRSTDVVSAAAVKYQGELVASAMHLGLTRKQAERLIGRYFEIPPEISTTVKAKTAQAWGALGQIITRMNVLANGVQVPVSYVQRGPGLSAAVPSYANRLLGRASGGPVYGPGTGTSDSIPLWGSNGEYMVNARSTAKYFPLIEAINADRFADGGMIGYATGGKIKPLTPGSALAELGKTSTAKSLSKDLQDTVSEIKSASKTLNQAVRQAYTAHRISYATAEALLTRISNGNTRLQALANKRDALVKKIEDAKQYSTGVRDNARTFAGLTNLDFTGNTRLTSGDSRSKETDSATPPPTAGAIRGGLQAKLAQIKKFRSVVIALGKRGLSKSLLRQVIDAGPEQGLALGEALLAASKTDFSAINTAQAGINTYSKSLGLNSADLLYDAGAKAGKGFLTGLTAQKKDIVKAMDSIADALVKAVRTRLKIRSPSVVAYDDMRQVGAGAIRGLDAMRRPVTAAATRMASAALPSVALPATVARAGLATGGGTVVNHYTITVQGAIDPISTAKTLEKTLAKLRRDNGRTNLAFTS